MYGKTEFCTSLHANDDRRTEKLLIGARATALSKKHYTSKNIKHAPTITSCE